MKRFIDLRGKATPYRFCWWDTIKDQFETHNGEMAWDTWEDFAGDCTGDWERYKTLCPPWAFEKVNDNDD